MTSLRVGLKWVYEKLSICLFLVLFGFSAPSFADHLLKKSKEESLIFHKQRMNELPNNAHPIWKL
jgi:hypothetical protein